MLDARRLAQPLRTPAFRRLAGGRLLSYLGDWLVAAALVGWVYAETGSTAHVALLLVVRLLPLTIGSGLACAIVDRLDRKRLLVALEAARTCAALAVLVSVNAGPTYSVFACVAIFSVLAAVSGVTVRALSPATIRPEQLPHANAVLAIAQETAMTLGALAAGLMLSAAAVDAALTLAVGVFAIAALSYARVAAPRTSAPARGARGIRAGVRHVLERPVLRVLVFSFALATLATGLVNASLPRLLGDEHGLGAGAYGYGLAALALGLLLGEAAAGLAPAARVGTSAFGAALAAMAVGLAALALAPDARIALLFLAAVGFANGIAEVVWETAAQREADPAFYGRVFGFASSLLRTTMMGAVAAAPAVNALGPPGRAILVAAGIALGAAVLARRRTSPGLRLTVAEGGAG